MNQRNTYFKICKVCSVIMYRLSTGPPGNVSDVNIPPDTITACSFVVQWSRPSNDPVCDPVQYTVTVTDLERMLIINDTTTLADYNVTGLTNNTSYHVTVTASNNAGSSSATMLIRTNSNGKSTRSSYVCMYVYVLVKILFCYNLW